MEQETLSCSKDKTTSLFRFYLFTCELVVPPWTRNPLIPKSSFSCLVLVRNEKNDNDYRYIIWKLKSSQFKIVGHCSLMLFHPQRKRTAQLGGLLPSTKVVSKLTSHTLKLSLFYTRRLSHFQIFTLSNSHKFHTFAFTHSQIFTLLNCHTFTVGWG